MKAILIVLTILLMSTACSAQETIGFSFNGIWVGSTATHDINKTLGNFEEWKYSATLSTGITFVEKLNLGVAYKYPYPLVSQEGKYARFELSLAYKLL